MKLWIAVAAGVLFSTSAFGADKTLAWPQFRGPDGAGVADDQKPPPEFGPEKNLKWKIEIPSGISSPIIAGDKLVITALDDGKLYTIAYNRVTGAEAWRAEAAAKQLEPFHKVEGSPATSTPATDGERIVSYFGSCGLICYDLSGKQLWKFELPPVKLPGEFGSGVSPIITDGMVVLVRDQIGDASIIAVDAAKGTSKWETKRLSPVSYSTPVVWKTAAGKQIAVAGHARMAGYDLKTGGEKWSVAGLPSGCCASPVIANGLLYFAGTSSGGPEDKESSMPKYDDLLKQLDTDMDGAISRKEAEKNFSDFFDNQDANKDGKVSRDEWDMILKFMSEGQNVAFALKPDGTGDVTASHLLWKQKKGLPYLATAILYRGRYFTVRDGGIVTALDPESGKEVYKGRIADGKYYSSPVAANGLIYFTSLNGEVTVVKANPDHFEIAVQNPPLDERTASTPAISDNTLYLRTEKHLYAFAANE